MEAICLICGIEFKIKSGSQKYCSEKCYKEHRKEYNKEYKKSDKYKKYIEGDYYKERRKEYHKEYYKEYKKSDKFKKKYIEGDYYKKYRKSEKYKKCQKELRVNLTDRYIKRQLKMFDAPKELIEAKREQLKLLRLIRQMS